jgi:Raf kinase inhibitor-like YbhB/YbcL family protein
MRKALLAILALAVAVAIATAQDKGKGGGGKGGGKGFQLPPSLKISVAGTSDMGTFPAANAGQGPSPAITWSEVPPGTQSFTLLFHDMTPVLNRSASTDVTHWLIYNIPGDARGLPAGVPAGNLPDGSRQVGRGYFGPAPPAGHGPHHYVFELWALDTKLDLPADAQRDAVIKAMDGHVLSKGVFVTTYENK